MNLINLFRKKGSAPVARDRLQILLAHERTSTGRSDLVDRLREEILEVIKKHVAVDSDKVRVKMERGEAVSTLDIDIEIPTAISGKPDLATAAAKLAEMARTPEKAKATDKKSAAA
ncbi:MAG: cell division topological specificity factor MinE [Bauldia sp.]|nr:cell division topological specificity factor MinE [Bauldia sp.]